MDDSIARTRPHLIEERRADLLACIALVAVIVATLIYLFYGGALGSIDSLVGLYPTYGLLGERIRSFELPLWNPWLVSGVPLAADLQSGWFYLPVMLGFGLFPIQIAAIFLSAIHLILAGFGTYGLARVLGIGPTGSLIAAFGYMLSGWYTHRMACCPADISTAAWLPVALVFTELALRAEPGGRRLCWLLLSAFSLSQMVSAWLGQGSYYGFLAVGGFLVYRTLIDPPVMGTFLDRLKTLGWSVLAIGLPALGLSAGGLLPRFEFYRISNLGEGYPEGTAAGWNWFRVSERLLGETTWYAGSVLLGLAVFGVLILGRRALAPFWLALVLFAVVMAMPGDGAIQRFVTSVVPGLESVQQNLPSRILTIAYLGIAMLAGGVVNDLCRWKPNRSQLAAFVALASGVIIYAIWADGEATTIDHRVILPLVGVVALLAIIAFSPERFRAPIVRVAPVLLLVAVVVDLATDGIRESRDQQASGVLSRVDLTSYYDPSPAALWLQSQRGGEPFRFAGMDPALTSRTRIGVLLYGRKHGNPMTAMLVVNNRAALLDLEDVQGATFPPLHLSVYDELMLALNGKPQDYHSAAILSWEALSSPIVDLLDLRYIVVPRVDADGLPPPESALTGFTEVWADDQVRILENNDALPRSWLVRDVQVSDPGTMLSRIADGSIDPRSVALIEEPLPDAFAPGPATAGDSVSTLRESDEGIEVSVVTSEPALLVFSEITNPGWQIHIDGERADVVTVNHALIGVAVPAGEHTIELEYAGRTEKIAAAISLLTIIAIAGYGVWWRMRTQEDRRQETETGI